MLGTELQRKMIRECGDCRRYETVRMDRTKRCRVSSGRHLAAGIDQRTARDIPQDIGEGHIPEARNWLQVWRHLEGDVRRRQLGGSGRSRLQRVWEAGACHGQIA